MGSLKRWVWVHSRKKIEKIFLLKNISRRGCNLGLNGEYIREKYKKMITYEQHRKRTSWLEERGIPYKEIDLTSENPKRNKGWVIFVDNSDLSESQLNDWKTFLNQEKDGKDI